MFTENQIRKGSMATIIGIFEHQFIKKIPPTVVRPGTQTRKFTDISDTIAVYISVWKKIVANIIQYLQKKVIPYYKLRNVWRTLKFLPERSGERYASALPK